MIGLSGFQWLAPPRFLGQAIGDYCSRLSPDLFNATLSSDQQFEYSDLRARYDRGDSLTQQERTALADYEARCNEAYRSTGIPQGASPSVYALQKQINAVLSSHGCRIGEDGILGSETCGAIALISERQWGNVQAPEGCNSVALSEPTGCREAAVAAAKRGGGGGAAILIGALVVLGIAGLALAGRT